jgi:hypothetical protein
MYSYTFNMGSHQEYFLYGALIILLLLILMHFSNPVVSIYDRYLYFDYNGTTPPHKAVARKVYESSCWEILLEFTRSSRNLQ